MSQAARWLHPQQLRIGRLRPAVEKVNCGSSAVCVPYQQDIAAVVQQVVPRVIKYGVCQIDAALPTSILIALQAAHDRRVDEVYASLEAARDKARGTGAAPSEVPNACIRDGARLDVVGLECSALEAAAAVWEPIVSVLLERSVRRVWTGSILGLPAAEDTESQRWHADTPHLYSIHLPPHSITVHIPLIDLTLENGPTEFRLGSHILGQLKGEAGDGEEESDDRLALCAPRGSVILYDERIEHRGLKNCTEMPRPIAYCTYAKAWYRDVVNKKASAQ